MELLPFLTFKAILACLQEGKSLKANFVQSAAIELPATTMVLRAAMDAKHSSVEP
jgi:hypothetical protein